jgi:hypothetical protein
MPVTFLLSWPAKIEVLAVLLRALPRARVGLLVLGQIAWSLKLLLAVTANVHYISWLLGLTAARHGAGDFNHVHAVLGGIRETALDPEGF